MQEDIKRNMTMFTFKNGALFKKCNKFILRTIPVKPD